MFGPRMIGKNQPCFIVAEVSGNHHQKYDEAEALVRAAAKAGADAVKLQTYTPDTLTIDCDDEAFMVKGKDNPDSWKGRTLYQLYQEAYTPWEWQPKLQKVAEECGILFFSSAFDDSSVEFLENMNVPGYKIASYELTHLPLLERIAQTKKPVIASVGFSTLEEITEAVKTLKEHGCDNLALLHCVTSYSDNPQTEDMHLATIHDLAERFNVSSGFSDNNAGIEIPIAAVASGASIIEKHLILDRTSGGPDAKFSLEPAELQEMVRRIRSLEQMRGSVAYGPLNEAEKYNQRFRRSIFVTADIKQGETFSEKNIQVIRPALGLPSRHWHSILGKTASADLRRGTPLLANHVDHFEHTDPTIAV